MVGLQPVGRGGGVHGQTEGGGGSLQPNHFQALPTRGSTWRWDAQWDAQRKSQWHAQGNKQLWSHN